jgi:hypothetical protein
MDGLLRQFLDIWSWQSVPFCKFGEMVLADSWTLPRLTADELACLKKIENHPVHCALPDAHRKRLIELGYIRTLVFTRDGYALALTGRGLRRLSKEK